MREKLIKGTTRIGLAVLLCALCAGRAAAAPGRPCGLSALARSTTEVGLTWEDTADNETGFRVELRQGSQPFQLVRNVGTNVESTVVGGLQPGMAYDFRVRSFNAGSTSAYTDIVPAITDSMTSGPTHCTPGPTEVCLASRFLLSATWRSATGGGPAIPVPVANRSAAFYFFSPDNLELLVKVLDACSFNNRYWVFYSAGTNVEFKLTVTDTTAPRIRQYVNPLGRPAPPVQDVSAFATCP